MRSVHVFSRWMDDPCLDFREPEVGVRVASNATTAFSVGAATVWPLVVLALEPGEGLLAGHNVVGVCCNPNTVSPRNEDAVILVDLPVFAWSSLEVNSMGGFTIIEELP